MFSFSGSTILILERQSPAASRILSVSGKTTLVLERPLPATWTTVTITILHTGGCQNYGPLLGPLNTWCRKGSIILPATHMQLSFDFLPHRFAGKGTPFNSRGASSLSAEARGYHTTPIMFRVEIPGIVVSVLKLPCPCQSATGLSVLCFYRPLYLAALRAEVDTCSRRQLPVLEAE